MKMNKIILAMPNSASESFMQVINEKSNHKSEQLFTFQPNFLSNLEINNDKLSFLKKIKISLSKIQHKLIYPRTQWTPFRISNPSLEFSSMANFHGDIANFDRALFSQLLKFLNSRDNYILKQHFPPTLNNRIFFKNFKKIIIIRDPEEVINKYYDSELIANKEFREKIIEEIKLWISLWSEEKNTLVIEKNDLIKNTFDTLKKIEPFIDIKFNIDENYKFPFINKTNKIF